MSLQPSVFEALSHLALRLGQRVSARELMAQTAEFGDEDLSLLAAAKTLESHGLDVQIAALKPAEYDSRLGPVVIGLAGGWAAVLLSRKGDACEVIAPHLNDSLNAGQTQWVPVQQLATESAGWSLHARIRQDSTLEHPSAPQNGQPQGDIPPSGTHWFWSVFRTLRGFYLDSTLAAMLINLLALATSMFSMNVYDRVIPNAALHSLWVLALGVTLAGLLELGLRTMRGYLVDVAGKKADLLLSSRIFKQALNLRAQDRPVSSGQFAGQLREFESVRDFVSSTTLVTLSDVPFVIVFLCVIGFFGGPLVWVPIVGAVLVFLAGWASQWPIRESIARYQYESAQKLGFMVETLERLEQIRAMGAEPRMQSRWERISATTARSAMTSRWVSAITLNFTQFVQQACNTALIVWGVYLILEGRLTAGGLIGCTILAGRALGPLAQVAGLLTRYQHAVGAFKTLDRIMRLPGQYEPQRSYMGLHKSTGHLQVRQLQFSYPYTERPVLQIQNLDLAPGEHVALMGPVGSGKSTLLKMLACLYPPTQGQVLLDGLDMAHISPADLRAQLAWVSQDAVLFRGSLRDNLLMAAPHVSDARLQHVLQLTGIQPWVAVHPQGLDMPLGEAGAALSGGQRQMVALARALLANCPVVLLDEPTSAFDAASEQRLLNNLQTELAGKTVVIATHRPGPLSLVTRLVLLDSGQVLADGPKEAVLQAVQEGRVKRAIGRTA
ncbi:type I secretion system permease/ATPase [Limnohabitans sp. DM1]|uniref:type I secretion system permease/ATPase n=1 Tax=Limnohabitans sp. DM1 TaxID=1597955 RepID=UPI000A785850|nr:type I secretion system permease/ATPase [Limnohabitans sp. DM1]